MKAFLIIAVAWAALLPATAVGQGTKKNPPAKKTTSQAADRRLSLDQIRKLISIQTPDSLVAQEVQARGVNGDYGRREIEQLRQQGAGSETITALTRLMPVATLTVRTEPGATVKLDGGSPALAAAEGTATLSNIDPGRHQVTAEKQYFTSASRAVELKGRETASIDIKLEWAVGFLTVNTDVPDAQIRVSGAAPQVGRTTRLAVPIGQANVTATAPFRKSISQTVVIEPGKESTVSLALPLDSVALMAAANQIHQSFRAGSYQMVLQQSAQYLQVGVKDKDVLAEVALSNLQLVRLTEFSAVGHEALAAGATLRFQVHHRHGGFNAGLHPAVLIVTSKTLGFEPSGKCNTAPFELGWNEVRSLETPYPIVLKISLPNPSNPKKQSTVEFWQDVNSRVPIRPIFEFLSSVKNQYH